MKRHSWIVVACALFVLAVLCVAEVQAQQGQTPQAYGRQWGGTYSTQDWNRSYHYPYVYYPQNFYSRDYYRSSNDMMNRYPPEMRVPAYNPRWQNYYPAPRRYHQGHHFILDIF